MGFNKEKASKMLSPLKKATPALKQFSASVLCILFGFIIGIIVMFAITLMNKDLGMSDFKNGIEYLFKGPFSSTRKATRIRDVGNMIFYTVPLIMTGLSVAIAYKTGLFNIGAPGQFLMGITGSLSVALSVDCADNRSKGLLVWVLAILVGTILGALWGAIPGIFKALFNINEVVVCIMTNWIAANAVTWWFSTKKTMINTPAGKTAYLFTPGKFGTYSPTWGLDKIFTNSYLDCTIILAIIIAIVMWVIMNKTKFGFELKACGANKHAAKYAGMSEKRNIILSMAISGALAALGGCFYYLGKRVEFNYLAVYQSLPAYGFDGIPAALLANCDPIGTIFSATFLRFISASGSKLQAVGYNQYIASVISAVIIYCAGFSRLFLALLSRKKKMVLIPDAPVVPGNEEVKKTEVVNEEIVLESQPTEEKKEEAE